MEFFQSVHKCWKFARGCWTRHGFWCSFSRVLVRCLWEGITERGSHVPNVQNPSIRVHWSRNIGWSTGKGLGGCWNSSDTPGNPDTLKRAKIKQLLSNCPASDWTFYIKTTYFPWNVWKLDTILSLFLAKSVSNSRLRWKIELPTEPYMEVSEAFCSRFKAIFVWFFGFFWDTHSRIHDFRQVWASAPTDKEVEWVKKLGLQTTTCNTELVKNNNVVVLSAKPQVLPKILKVRVKGVKINHENDIITSHVNKKCVCYGLKIIMNILKHNFLCWKCGTLMGYISWSNKVIRKNADIL